MSRRDEYQTRMEEQLNEWTARLDALKRRVGTGLEPQQQLHEWTSMSIHAFAQLAELKATTGDAWDSHKLEMEKTWLALAAVLGSGPPPPSGKPA
jgi:hypothetical protein